LLLLVDGFDFVVFVVFEETLVVEPFLVLVDFLLVLLSFETTLFSSFTYSIVDFIYFVATFFSELIYFFMYDKVLNFTKKIPTIKITTLTPI